MTTTNLIIQAEDVSTPDLKALHTLARAKTITRIEQVAHQAFKLTAADINTQAAVKAYCQAARLDFAFVPETLTLGAFGLIALDMDSTLITIECIDEIADFAGCREAVAAITAAAMRGELDWPTSLRQRVATLQGLPETVLEQVYSERLRLSPGAEKLIAAAKRHGIRLLLVSGGFTFFTERLKQRLGLDYAFSNTLDTVDGRLTGQVLGNLCDADAKAKHLREIASSLGLQPTQVMAIGDGANDLKMTAEAQVSIAYHAKPLVQEEARFALNQVGLDGVLALFG